MNIKYLVVLMVAILALIITAPAFGSTTKQVIKLNKHVKVTVVVESTPVPAAVRGLSGSTGDWIQAKAKCVVKYYDIPLVRAFQYTVTKHWQYNTKKNLVRQAVTATDPWINAALKAKGDWWEEYGAVNYFYSRSGGNNFDAHYSERHVKFHAIFGIKGVCLPIGTWYVNVWFRAFAKNRPGTNQPWRCDVTQKWHYAD
jgi:hypothetical protein